MRKKPKKKGGLAQPTEPRPFQIDRWRGLLAAASLAILTALAFSNSFSGGIVLDNKLLLLQDSRIRELTGENIRLILQHTYWWPTGETGLYRPFTTLSFLFNYAVLGNGTDPAGYHWINFLLHLGNVFLVYALARRLLRSLPPAFFAAALWAVHPVLTESVTNIIGRSDLLSAMAVLSGFLMYLRATESAGLRRLAWLSGLAGVTAVGVLSKESAVTIVGVIALYELSFWKERKHGRVLLLGCAATLLPIAAMLYQRSIVLAASRPWVNPFVDNPIVGAGFWSGRLTAVKVIARYLWLIVWPASLSSDYSYAQIPLVHGTLQDWLACIAVLAASILVLWLYRSNRPAFFLACFAAVTFAPVSNLLFPIGTIMAERFLYLPAIGLLACLVMAIEAAAKRLHAEQFAPAVFCVILLAFAVRTWVRNIDWHDELAMYEGSVRTSPNSFKVHAQLASVLYASGPAGSNLDRALEEVNKALAILDALPDARNAPDVYRLAGGLYIAKGDALHDRDPSLGLDDYRRALQLLHRSIAIRLSERPKDDGKREAEWARRHPALPNAASGDPEADWMLAAVCWRLGNAKEADVAAGEALALHPAKAEGYRQIALGYANEGRMDEAALALMEGGLITSDPGLRSDLLDLYRTAFGNSCAITTGPNGPTFNLSCDLVHKQFCAASVEVVETVMDAGRMDQARKQKQDLIQKYGCPAGPLEHVLPD